MGDRMNKRWDDVPVTGFTLGRLIALILVIEVFVVVAAMAVFA